jgi:hypothetical protein
VKEIVGLHQGTIGVASQINAGTTFSVCLPVYESGEPVAFSRSNNTTKALPMEQSKEVEVSEIE